MNGVGVPRVDPDCVHHLSLLVSESLPHITRASRVSVAPPTHCSVRASPHSTVRGGRPGDQVRTILGGAPRGCFTFRDLCSLALSSMKPFTSGCAPNFQVQISSSLYIHGQQSPRSARPPNARAPACGGRGSHAVWAFIISSPSSISSVQQLLHSCTSCSSLTNSASL